MQNAHHKDLFQTPISLKYVNASIELRPLTPTPSCLGALADAHTPHLGNDVTVQ